MTLNKPWLWLPSQLAHDVGPYALKALTALRSNESPLWNPVDWRGLRFSNPMGLSGGVDKSGATIPSWWKLGPGFVEIGTVTPREQGPNPGQIMDRNTKHQALWNKMGFPNPGMNALLERMQKWSKPYPTPVFVNIGKNRDTPNESAADDYVTCMHGLHEYADAFVVNISSPNTKGLRDLAHPETFAKFLKPILDEREKLKGPPTLLKLSPDMDDESLKNILDVGCDLGIDGWIVTNTTASRPVDLGFSDQGGLSGAPLRELSIAALEKTLDFLGERKAQQDQLVISAGGIIEADDVVERLAIGADLVQTYSGIVFGGPYFFLNTLKELSN